MIGLLKSHALAMQVNKLSHNPNASFDSVFAIHIDHVGNNGSDHLDVEYHHRVQ